MRKFSFIEFLNESITPKETEYGTDGKNKKWSDSVDGYHHTFFSHTKDHHVLVAIHKHTGEISFTSKRGEFSNNASEYDYDTTPKRGTDAHHVLGKVMHVGIEGADTFNHKKIQLSGETAKHERVYARMVNNKAFGDHLKTHGFEYKGFDKENKRHIFEKIKGHTK